MARNLISPSQTFAGTLDEIELFNRVLDTSEVRKIWAADTLGKCQDTCHSTGDANNNGFGLSMADLIYLANFINACGPAPVPLYSCDLNGDGYVNAADLQLYQDYFVYGMSVFAPYGGYPVLCPCDPIPAPVPDSVRIFGLDHESAGPTCLGVSGGALTVTRFMADMAPEGIIVDIPDAISSPPSTIIWRGELQNPDLGGTLPAGATIKARFANYKIGFPPPEPIDPFAMVISMSKAAANTWNLALESDAASYTIKASYNDSTVFSVVESGTTGLGYIVENAKGIHPVGFSGASTGKPASIVASSDYDFTAAANGVQWTWGAHGVSNLQIDYLSISKDIDTACRGLDYVGIYAQQMDSFTVTSETYSFGYGDIMVTPLGDATVTPVDTTLVVSNIGSSGLDGMDAEKDDKDGDWAIVWRNPDSSGALPVGASVGTKFYFATPTDSDSLSMGLSMTKAAANTWNLAVQSIASSYTVQAFNNGSSVFSIAGISATGLGYIVENAKGVHPVGFTGASSGKPASIVASSGYDFTASPNGVQWTWAAHGVSNLQIDYLSISTEVPGTSLFGVTHATMCGANGAKADPISFTILDITVVPFYICGDATGNGIINALDVTFLINYLYKHGAAPNPIQAGDANGNGIINALDVTYLINFLYKHGPTPNCPPII